MTRTRQPIAATDPAGSDLRSTVRSLRALHEATFSGVRLRERPRPVVARSWERMRASGLTPDGSNRRSALTVAEVDRRREQSRISAAMPTLRTHLGSVADSAQFVVVVSDADGVLLWREGATQVLRRADQLGFEVGVRWGESEVGTNAIGTALAERAPVTLLSAEHFERTQHPWYCTAAPLHDPATGELIGVVDVSGPAMMLHPAVTALVSTAVRLAEQTLAVEHRSALARLATTAATVTTSTRGPYLLVDDHGWVAQSSGLAAPDRVAVPHDGRPLDVPGLGHCRPERLPGGWLIRPRGENARIVGRLDLTDRPVLELRSDDDPWRVVLTDRHAEILTALIAAGSAGMTAAALSARLFGDTDHAVTVRAEISRLRRAVGALVATGPYRIAPGVRLQVMR